MLKLLVLIAFLVGSVEGLINGDCNNHECQNGAECRIQYAVPWFTNKDGHVQTCKSLADSIRSRATYEAMCEIKGYYCICSSQFHGEQCEKEISKFSTVSTTSENLTTAIYEYEGMEVSTPPNLTTYSNNETNTTTSLVVDNVNDHTLNATSVDPVFEALKINKATPVLPVEFISWNLFFYGSCFVFCFVYALCCKCKKIIQSPEWTIPVLPSTTKAQRTPKFPIFWFVFNTPLEEAVDIDYEKYLNYDDGEHMYINL